MYLHMGSLGERRMHMCMFFCARQSSRALCAQPPVAGRPPFLPLSSPMQQQCPCPAHAAQHERPRASNQQPEDPQLPMPPHRAAPLSLPLHPRRCCRRSRRRGAASRQARAGRPPAGARAARARHGRPVDAAEREGCAPSTSSKIGRCGAACRTHTSVRVPPPSRAEHPSPPMPAQTLCCSCSIHGLTYTLQNAAGRDDQKAPAGAAPKTRDKGNGKGEGMTGEERGQGSARSRGRRKTQERAPPRLYSCDAPVSLPSLPAPSPSPAAATCAAASSASG